MVSFSLSAVMSTPQVVKGLKGDAKRIRAAIATGLGINLALIFIITLMTLLGAGGDISEDGALVDLSRHLGGWVAIVGYIFTLLALATSFWANTLNLRDIVGEQTGWSKNLCWLLGLSALPCACAVRREQLRRFHTLCEHNSDSHRHRDHHSIQPLTQTHRSFANMRQIRLARIPDTCHRFLAAFERWRRTSGELI